MKKILSILAFTIAVVVQANAQAEFTGFTITTDGYYRAPDGKDYIIYPFDGKSANEIYSLICSNVAKVYNSPQRVMSTVENTSVAIHAFADDILYQKSYLGLKFFYEGTYNLLIEIKDGRVKVNAPSFGMQTGQSETINRTKTAEKILSDFFDKKGRLKENRTIWKPYAEQRINSIYKTLLGIDSTNKTDNDW